MRLVAFRDDAISTKYACGRNQHYAGHGPQRASLNARSRLGTIASPFRSQFDASERRLSWLVERRMPLLSLAGKKSSLGAARIVTSDEQWQEDFVLLAQNAVAIFVQDPRDPLNQLTHLVEDFEGLAYELRTLAKLCLTSKLIFLIKGGAFEWQFDVPNHWAPPRARNFCEILSSAFGMRPLNDRSVREILDSFADYREIEPPILDRFAHRWCQSLVDMWDIADITREGRAKKTAKQIREIIEYERSPEARSRRRKERLQLLGIIVITTAFLILMEVCFGKH